MIDIPINIDIKSGLRSHENDTKGLIESMNFYLKPGLGNDVVLQSIPTPEAIIEFDYNWPFPQIIQLGYKIYILYPDTISELIDGLPFMHLNNIPTSGYPWGAAIVGAYPIFVNNRSVVYLEEFAGAGTLPNSGAPGKLGIVVPGTFMAPSFIVATSGKVPVGRDICDFSGRYIIAAPWMYRQNMMNSIAYSKVGAADFTQDRSNSAGIKECAGCGSVMRVIGTPAGIFVFGSMGVGLFTKADFPAIFSYRLLSPEGLYSQLAVTKANNLIYYVTTSRHIRKMDFGGKAEILGYEHILKDATSEIVLSYDSSEDNVYVSF
jgi:hypothetical protein